MPEQQSIKDTLDVIRKALETDENSSTKNVEDNILVLNKLVSKDGTVNVIDDQYLSKDEVQALLNDKLTSIFDRYLTKWLDKNVPKYLEKYFKNKDF